MAGKTETKCRKKKAAVQEEQGVGHEGYLLCQVCGRLVIPEECSWREDDGDVMCCRECRAERESCGCGD